MRKYLICLFPLLSLTFFCQTAFSQNEPTEKKPLSSEELFLKQNKHIVTKAGEKYLILNISPAIGKFHRVRFYPGDKIKFRLKNDRTKFHETIENITDSSFSVGVMDPAGKINYKQIFLTDINKIKVSRRIPFVTEASYYFPLAGLVYLGADFFNTGIDGKRFTTDRSSFIVAGALIASGFIFQKCRYLITKSTTDIN